MRNLIPLILMIGLWVSCSPAPVNTRSYGFQLTSVLDSLCNSLEKNSYNLLKKVNYSGKEEMIMQMNPEWKKELEPFYDGDLNKPAFTGAYKADTIIVNDSVLYRFVTNEHKNPVKRLSVLYTGEQLSAITISIKKSNAWFNLEQELSLSPGNGYRISGKQKMALGKEVKFTISGQFIKKETKTTQ